MVTFCLDIPELWTLSILPSNKVPVVRGDTAYITKAESRQLTSQHLTTHNDSNVLVISHLGVLNQARNLGD